MLECGRLFEEALTVQSMYFIVGLSTAERDVQFATVSFTLWQAVRL